MKKIAALFFGMAFAAFGGTIQLISNGGFETGDFTDWTVTTTDGSPTLGGWYVTSATATPLNGFPTVGPASGTYYAVSDAYEPGTRAISQTFTDPSNATDVALSTDIFVNDSYGGSGLGGEVEVIAGGANPLTATPIALGGPYDEAVTAGNPNGWFTVSGDITSVLTPGDSYQLVILESDSSGPINVGADNLSIIATTASSATPEPGSTVLSLSLICGFLIHRIRKVLA
jgi:hypothetical protein